MYKKLLWGSTIVVSSLSLHANEIETLTQKVNALTEEIAKIQENDSNSNTMEKLNFGGYGKMDYTNYRDSDSVSKLDMYRFILYAGYEFSDRVKLVSELEWEHGGRESTGGYGIVEQAYLDFKATDNLSVKVGHVLVPMGHVNLYHEPTAFNAVSRPEVEKYIIPSTWHENGIIAHGNIGNGLSYQAGIVAGLNAGNDSKGKGIRSMRQNGQKSKADDFGMVARVDYKGGTGFALGGSVYSGGADQSNTALSGVKTTLAEVHTSYNINGLNLRALYAMNKTDEAQKIAILNTKGSIGEGSGFYVNVAYDINSEWTPFIRFEKYNVKEERFDGTGAKIASPDDVVNSTIGINYKPAKNVVLKANYVKRDNAGTDDDRIEMGMGYSF
jgi:hypothetical protein